MPEPTTTRFQLISRNFFPISRRLPIPRCSTVTKLFLPALCQNPCARQAGIGSLPRKPPSTKKRTPALQSASQAIERHSRMAAGIASPNKAPQSHDLVQLQLLGNKHLLK